MNFDNESKSEGKQTFFMCVCDCGLGVGGGGGWGWGGAHALYKISISSPKLKWFSSFKTYKRSAKGITDR